jgi:hypothetical protein
MAESNLQCERLAWVFFLFAYLDEKSRQGKYYEITIVNQGEYFNFKYSIK